MTCLKLIEEKCDTYLFVDDTEIFQQIRHKSIGGMISEMALHISAKNVSCLKVGKLS